MADEAVNPTRDASRDESRERRWGSSGYAGEWVRATDAGDDRARWIEEDEAPPARPPEAESESEGNLPVA